MKYKYCVGEDSDPHFYEFESNWDQDNLEYLDEDCADDYHSNHDGWESHWPLVLKVATIDDVILAIFEIERESEPVFYARKQL